ncbi:glycine oxidase ThiO, partial [Alienimonas sp. DA493]|uniref:glycine oxidase ThiO n=1 Tax=Alienimonas sp. DA493 TaxID=3373605 RepID=UPI0037549119
GGVHCPRPASFRFAPPPDMPSPDVLIVGGGVIGLSCGVELARRGRSVLLLERDAVGARTGAASWAGAGMLPPASLEHAESPRDRLRAFAHTRWDDWAAALREASGVDVGYERLGSLHVSHPELGGDFAAEEAEQAAAAFRRGGVCAEWLPPEALRTEVPFLSREVAAVVRLPDAGQVRNPRLLRALRAAGGIRLEIREGTPVRAVRRLGGRAVGVMTEAGERLDAGAVLLCGGAWTGGLLAPLGFDAAVRPVRGQIALLRTPKRPFAPVIECGARYLVPRADGRTIVGATQEEVGFRPDTTAAGLAGLLDFAAALVPALGGAAVERCWAGLRPGTPDGNPLLGHVPGRDAGEIDGLFLAAGHFRDGLQQSPGAAAIVADLIEDRPPPVSLEGLAPGRFDAKGER